MKKILVILLIVMLAGFVTADRLPTQTPEAQLISSIEYFNVIGPVIKDVELISEQSSAYLHNGIVFGMDSNDQTFGEAVSQTVYDERVRTNGGVSEMTYTLGFDTSNTIENTYNLQTDTILSYQTVDGATMLATERATLDVVGNFENAADSLRCVFASNNDNYIPAFCNKVTAMSEVMGVTTMALQTTTELRDTAMTADVPAALRYKINVVPIAGTNYADGDVTAEFTASIREANGDLDTSDTDVYYAPGSVDWNTNYWDDEARITTYSDRTTLAGGITKVTKEFSYKSQMAL